MKDFWNKRYKEEAYVYGVKPNEYLKENLPVKTGKILLPADGEGRNSLFAALKGWEVTAFDYSQSAIDKANALFDKHQVSVDFRLMSYLEMNFEEASFHCIGLTYIHMPPDFRKKVHQHLMTFLKPNGILILEAFSKKQLPLKSGGPKHPAFLYDTALVKDDFKGLEIIELEEKQVILDEGAYHKGLAEVVRFVGKKTN